MFFFTHEPTEWEDRPSDLQEMVQIAGLLCEGFHRVRVDLNIADDIVYYGEMTFTGGLGFNTISESFDYLLSGLLNTTK